VGRAKLGQQHGFQSGRRPGGLWRLCCESKWGNEKSQEEGFDCHGESFSLGWQLLRNPFIAQRKDTDWRSSRESPEPEGSKKIRP
jgi:hypothetical protein